MQQEDLYDYRTHFRTTCERSTDKEGKPIDFFKAVWFNFGKGENIVDGQLEHSQDAWIHHSYDCSTEPQYVSYFRTITFI